MEQEAIFANAGQAVHVAFLIMAQEATQDAPLRKALIRVMESIKLGSGNQRWLDQLRGAGGGGTVNFEGLSPGDIRAQCALITQAVTTNLPEIERWVLQAKYGQTDFEDVDAVSGDLLSDALAAAEAKVQQVSARVEKARKDFSGACDVQWTALTKAARPGQPVEFQAARAALAEANHALAGAGSELQRARVAIDKGHASRLVDNGPGPTEVIDDIERRSRGGRRWAFSAERIAAIKGLSDWFAPMFPRIKPLAIDCMLGMLYANHKKIEISTRDLATSFGASHMTYYRASCKMRNHLRKLEESAMARLEPAFTLHGVSCGK